MAWAIARKSPHVLGVTTMPLTGVELARLYNGPPKGSGTQAMSDSYLEGGIDE